MILFLCICLSILNICYFQKYSVTPIFRIGLTIVDTISEIVFIYTDWYKNRYICMCWFIFLVIMTVFNIISKPVVYFFTTKRFFSYGDRCRNLMFLLPVPRLSHGAFMCIVGALNHPVRISTKSAMRFSFPTFGPSAFLKILKKNILFENCFLKNKDKINFVKIIFDKIYFSQINL